MAAACGKLSPFVYWGQDKKFVFLRVDLTDVEEPTVEINDNQLDFSAVGNGQQGSNKYQCNITFFSSINPKACQWRVKPRGDVEIKLAKATPDVAWARLNKESIKPAWLKVDFDHIQGDDDDDSSSGGNSDTDGLAPQEMSKKLAEEELLRKFKEEMDKPVELPENLGANIYLFFYNLIQFCNFTYITLYLWIKLLIDGSIAQRAAWESVGTNVAFSQIFMVLEIVHPLLKITRGSPLQPLIQVTGRGMIMGLLWLQPDFGDTALLWYLFILWAAIELVRYPFYTVSLFGTDVKLITWLRYTVWIPLFPAGFFCECLLIRRGIPIFEESMQGSLSLPNSLNWAFNLPTFLRIYLLIAIPSFGYLYRYMWIQRNKRYGKVKAE